MQTKLIALEAEKEMLNTEYRVNYDSFIIELDKIIEKWIKPFDARCLRRWIQNRYFNNEIHVCFEIGFFNTSSNRIDFGSDFSVDYSTQSNELRINYGTCGYHSKADIYQTQRVKLLSHIWENIEEIECELKTFCNNIMPIVLKYEEDINEVSSNINYISEEIKKEKEKDIDNSINVGATIQYTEDTSLRLRHQLFGGTWIITKRTPKYVFAKCISVNNSNEECKFKVCDVISHIYRGHMIITSKEN